MFRNMCRVRTPDHDDVPVIVPVIVFDLLIEPGVSIRVALNLDPVKQCGRDHHYVRTDGTDLFFLQNSYLSKGLFQKVEKRFAYVFVV